MRMFSAKFDCDVFGFKNNQKGYFYDTALKIMLIGKIVDYKLKAKVIHDGTNVELGRYFAAFKLGYKYNDWDLQNIIYVPSNINTIYGFLEFIKPLNSIQLKEYYKQKWLFNEIFNK